jgi:ABC-type nitrate/sulfonate/bicarbonate transport system permease component
MGLIKVFHLDPIIVKSPADVWRYLVTDSSASANRKPIVSGMWTTLGDAALGYVAGTVAAVLISVVFVLRRGVEQAFLPMAMVLRSVPLVAMTPIITLVFGRGPMGVTVITGIVVYFPTVVNLVLAMRSVPPQTSDLLAAYGAGPLTTLRKVQLPSAMPALLASARVAVPGALIGALLAEWLATGKGIGYFMLQAKSTVATNDLWGAVVTVTFVTVLLYAVVTIIEAPVLARFAPDREAS